MTLIRKGAGRRWRLDLVVGAFLSAIVVLASPRLGAQEEDSSAPVRVEGTSSTPDGSLDESKPRGQMTLGELRRSSGTLRTRDSGARLWGSVGKLLGVLVLLILAAGACIWFWRRRAKGRGLTGGSRCVEVLGQTSISPRHAVCLLRVGAGRVVLVGLSGDSMTPLCDIEDRTEVACLLESLGAGEDLARSDGAALRGGLE